MVMLISKLKWEERLAPPLPIFSNGAYLLMYHLRCK
jgi:hypothetical protein